MRKVRAVGTVGTTGPYALYDHETDVFLLAYADHDGRRGDADIGTVNEATSGSPLKVGEVVEFAVIDESAWD